MRKCESVLKKETITMLYENKINNYCWNILDRWAINSPDELIKLEDDILSFYDKLINQMTIEREALNIEPQLRLNMSDSEILAMHEINMNI